MLLQANQTKYAKIFTALFGSHSWNFPFVFRACEHRILRTSAEAGEEEEGDGREGEGGGEGGDSHRKGMVVGPGPVVDVAAELQQKTRERKWRH